MKSWTGEHKDYLRDLFGAVSDTQVPKLNRVT